MNHDERSKIADALRPAKF